MRQKLIYNIISLKQTRKDYFQVKKGSNVTCGNNNNNNVVIIIIIVGTNKFRLKIN